MKKLSIFIVMFVIFSLILTPVAFASSVTEPEEPPVIMKGNNGFGNGDQDAPGNSGNHNNAENSERSSNYPGNSKHDK